MEIDDYFVCKLKGMSIISPNDSVQVLSNHIKGYVLDGYQLWIVCNKIPSEIDQFTEVKVIHISTIQYKRPYIQHNHLGSSAVNKFQSQVRKT